MRFAIDLDGVICNFSASLVAIANLRWPGKFPPDFTGPSDWDYSQYLTKAQMAEVWRDIRNVPYFWENMGALPGLSELQQGIKPDDEIFFITSRVNTIGEPASVQSARWLHDRHLWPRAGYSTVLQVADPSHKAQLFQGLGLKHMLDDHAPTVAQLEGVGVKAFLLDQPWNRYRDDLPRVSSVTEYLEKIRALDAIR